MRYFAHYCPLPFHGSRWSTSQTHLLSLFSSLWPNKLDLKSTAERSNDPQWHQQVQQVSACSQQASLSRMRCPFPWRSDLKSSRFRLCVLVFLSFFLHVCVCAIKRVLTDNTDVLRSGVCWDEISLEILRIREVCADSLWSCKIVSVLPLPTSKMYTHQTSH